MTTLRFGGQYIDIDLVIFDKDGTLIDFEFYWGERTFHCVEHLVAGVNGDRELRNALFHSLGFDANTQSTAGDGPLASATMPKLYNIAAVVLYQHGFGWDEAEDLARQFFIPCMAALPTADLVQPLGDIPTLFQALSNAGLRIAIVTSDDHDTAAQTLALLDVAEYVSVIVGGDDDLPMKPAPDAIFHVCDQLGISLARTAMVGDTVTDMVMATRAKVGQRVAVLSGVGTRDSLKDHSEFVIDSIAAIQLT